MTRESVYKILNDRRSAYVGDGCDHNNDSGCMVGCGTVCMGCAIDVALELVAQERERCLAMVETVLNARKGRF